MVAFEAQKLRALSILSKEKLLQFEPILTQRAEHSQPFYGMRGKHDELVKCSCAYTCEVTIIMDK